MTPVDKKILEVLNSEARTPHAQIAETVGLSRPAVADRIKKLEQSGIIKGYAVILSPEKLGQHITAFISAKYPGVLNEEAEQALRKLQQEPEILEMHSVAGEDCFLIKVRTSDMKSLNQIVHELKKPPLMLTTKTTIVLESYFEKLGGVVLEEQHKNRVESDRSN